MKYIESFFSLLTALVVALLPRRCRVPRPCERLPEENGCGCCPYYPPFDPEGHRPAGTA